MALLRRLWWRLVHGMRPERGEAELSRELAAHLLLVEDELQRQGLPPERAHREARRRLGGVERTRALHRAARSASWIEHLRSDVRAALRSMVRHPRATAVAILILASTGAINALILGVADGVLLRPLPYRKASQLFVIMMRHERSGVRSTSVPGEVLTLFRNAHPELSGAGAISSLAPVRPDPPAGSVRPLSVHQVTREYLDILGVSPQRGRLFDQQDREGHAALVTHEVWTSRFGGAPSIAGQSIAAGGRTFDVIGVLPPGLFFPSLFGAIPDILTLSAFPDPNPAAREAAFYPVVRLPPGTSLARAQARVTALASAVVSDTPRGRSLPELVPIDDVLFPSGRPIMRFLLAAAGLLVVLACVNLGGLLLVRGRRRAQEIGIKLALGARLTHLVRPVLFEVLIVSAIGGAIAVLVARLIFEKVLREIPRIAYGNAPVGLDLRVSLLTVGCGLAGALLFTYLPSWRATRRDALMLLRSTPSRTTTSDWTTGRSLVALQVGLSVLLVFGATITARAFMQVLSVPLGFDAERVASFSVPIPADADRLQFLSATLDRVRQHPLVLSAGAMGHMPFDGAAPDEAAMRPGQADENMLAGIVHAFPGALDALNVPLVAGRMLVPRDVIDDVDAAVVSQQAAAALFGTDNPLGGVFMSSSGRRLHVVGVVADIRESLERDPSPTAYMIPTAGRRPLKLILRLGDRRDDVIRDLQSLLGVPPSTVSASPWYADQVARVTEYRNPRFQTTVLVTLGGAALCLTICGIAGVVGFLVSSRTRELGIRLVVGANPVQLIGFVVRQAAVPVVAGLAVGLAATYWIGKLAEAQLFKVQASDPAALAITAVVILFAGTAAAYFPARRAGRIDPVVALRTE